MFFNFDAESVKANANLRTIVAVLAGVVAFLVVCGVVFGSIYLVLVYVLPRPEDLLVFNLNVTWGFLIAMAIGSIAGGYSSSRLATHAKYMSGSAVIVVLSALHEGYVLCGPHHGRDLPFEPILPTICGCLPFFAVGIWMGSRKWKRPRNI